MMGNGVSFVSNISFQTITLFPYPLLSIMFHLLFYLLFYFCLFTVLFIILFIPLLNCTI